MRIDQPLFGDVCNRMRDFDFEFIDFISICRWERDRYTNLGQAIFGDALFMKTPEYMIKYVKENKDTETGKKIKSYLAVLIIYERHDLALKFLDLLSATSLIDSNYIDLVRTIAKRRRKKLDNCHRFLTRANSFISIFGSPNTTSHLIY